MTLNNFLRNDIDDTTWSERQFLKKAVLCLAGARALHDSVKSSFHVLTFAATSEYFWQGEQTTSCLELKQVNVDVKYTS